jgi:hypothetical protein
MNDLETSTFEDFQADAPRCRACGGPLVFFGTLGGTDWGRCRNCGMDGQMNEDDAPGTGEEE